MEAGFETQNGVANEDCLHSKASRLNALAAYEQPLQSGGQVAFLQVRMAHGEVQERDLSVACSLGKNKKKRMRTVRIGLALSASRKKEPYLSCFDFPKELARVVALGGL